MTTAATIAKALDPEKFRKSGNGYVCRCPSHDDRNASLKISDSEDGKILVHCFAGCDRRDVIAEADKLGVWPKIERKVRAPRKPPRPANDQTPPAANDDEKPKVKPREVAKYEYFDHETGELLMQVVRFEPKDFRQRRPDPSRPGMWANNVSAEHRTLYNAPRAFRHDKAVLVVEGEKDVDNLAEIGVVAVCNPGGAGKWQPNYSEILRDKDVVLVPDIDPQMVKKATGEPMFHVDGRPKHPGQDHADLVGAALQGVARSVKIVHLPDMPLGSDISDWLAAGGTRAQLSALIKAAPLWAPPVAPARPVEELPDQTREAAQQHDDAPFRCLGYNDGTFYYLPRGQQQVVGLTAGAHTKNNMISLAPLQWWEAEFRSGDSKGGFNVDMATNWMIHACVRNGVWDPSDTRGRGSWHDDGRIVVHCGDMLYVDRTPMAPSQIRSQYVYKLGKPMRAAIDNPLSRDDATLYLEHMRRMPFSRDLEAVMMAGWTVCAHIGGVLDWRPHVWLVGAKGTGKSYVMDRVVKPLFGPQRCLPVASSTTEAGLRQSLGSDAIPVLFDEAEGQDATAVQRIQRILETVRQSSSETGAKITKGTTSGTSMSFSIRSCFMFASINASIVQQSDRSRITVVELKAERKQFELPELNKLGQFLIGDEYAQQFQARAINLATVIRHNAQIFAMVAGAALGEQRAGDQYGALLAGAYSLQSDEKATVEQAEAWLNQFDLAEDKAEVDTMSDERRCLDRILESKLEIQFMDKRETRTVAEWISDGGENQIMLALQREGIHVLRAGHPARIVILNDAEGIKKILRGSPWEAGEYNKVMKRLPGAEALPRSIHIAAFKTMKRGLQIDLGEARG